jgi:hypothetical protein
LHDQWQQPLLKLSEIDPCVLSELPYHIQLEVRRAAGDSSVAAPGGGATARKGPRPTKGPRPPAPSGSARAAGDGRQQRQPVRGGISKYFSSKATSIQKNRRQQQG